MEEGIFTREERDKLLQEIERLKFHNIRLSQLLENDTYKAFFDAYPDIVFKINTNYIVSFIHLPYRTPDYIESITNKHMFDLTPPSFQPAMKSALDEGFHTGKPVVYTCEGDFLGEYRYYENYLSPIKDSIGNVTEMFFYSRDVTVQKNIQHTLLKSQHTLKTIFENSGQFITIIDPDRKISWFNKKSEEWSPLVFGSKLELGCLAEQFLPEENQESFINHFNQVLQGTSINYVRKYLLEGNPFYLEIFLNPVYENDVISGIALIGVDVTKHKENEEYLQNANVELRHQNNQLNEFSYIISHNLRGPIATLMGLVDLFEISNKDESQGTQFLYHIKKTLQKLDGVIVDLNFVVTNHDKSVSNFSWIQLEEECNSISDLLSIQIQQSEARFIYDFSDYPAIYSVKSYIHNLLYNLISNAIKYKKHSFAPIIYLSCYKIDNGHFCIECRDNGIGLDLERYKDKMFGFYKRFHTHVEGKGIGLHIVKKQISLLKGKIEVISAIDQGTTFKIFLPIV